MKTSGLLHYQMGCELLKLHNLIGRIAPRESSNFSIVITCLVFPFEKKVSIWSRAYKSPSTICDWPLKCNSRSFLVNTKTFWKLWAVVSPITSLLVNISFFLLRNFELYELFTSNILLSLSWTEIHGILFENFLVTQLRKFYVQVSSLCNILLSFKCVISG